MDASSCDFAVVGGGIVGMATAMALAADPRLKIVVLEAEDHLAAHQSGHNTGIIHSGIYYTPGSLKARLCVEGRRKMERFCQEHGVRFERCGKLILAVHQRDLKTLDTLEARAQANHIGTVRRLPAEAIREIEPHATGLGAIHVPESGIVDYAEVTRAIAGVFTSKGGEVRTGARLLACKRVDGGLRLETTRGDLACRYLVASAGVQADRVARLCGVHTGMRIVPFRGQFYEVVPERSYLVKHLMYPAPNLRIGFLGEHLTRNIHGKVEADPNGAIALSRTDRRLGAISARDVAALATFPGFWITTLRHLKTGVVEIARALSKRAFCAGLQRMVPELRPDDLRKSRAGIHAQAVWNTGALVDDFQIQLGDRMVHVLNTISPAATSSLALGEHIAALARSNLPQEGPATLNVPVSLPEAINRAT